ncbi:MAG: histidine phosphatase family protein [Spirochaetes bacterium]|nr:MAG: histidine phosphatase family protein [Spirochaetota bacterium]
MSELYCIRHGQASFGKENYDVLSPTGTRQSALLASHLHALGARFDALYSGTLERQRYSAAAFIDYYTTQGVELPAPVTIPGLDEYDSKAILTAILPGLVREDPTLAPDIEALFTSRKSFQRVFERAMLRWVGGGFESNGLESWNEFQERVKHSLTRIMKENGAGKRVIVFTSGGTISASVQYATGLSGEETMRLCWQVVNSSVTRFKYSEERLTLASFNDYCHLEMNDGGALITYR